MPEIERFVRLLDEIRALHKKKNDDYANEQYPFFNFEFTMNIIQQFNRVEDVAFVWPIANKLGRLAQLRNSGEEANNESVEDSMKDIAICVLLWAAYLMEKINPQITNAEEVCRMIGKDN